MPKAALSVTLDQDNLLWLKARTAARKGRSLSETLDELVRAARQHGDVKSEWVRSVVGTVDLSPDDPELTGADAYIRGLFDASLARPMQVRERPATYAKADAPLRPKGKRRRG